LGNNRIIQENSNIWIKNFHPSLRLPFSKISIIQLINSVFFGERRKIISIFVNFITNKEIKKINKKFLGHDYFTDIITFPYQKNGGGIEGELFISLDCVKNNSKLYKTGYRNELKRVIIHGCLHLAGYDDKNKKQINKIRKIENLYLNT